MKYFFSQEKHDCFKCCLLTYLSIWHEIEYNEMPNFFQEFELEDIDKHINDWLRKYKMWIKVEDIPDSDVPPPGILAFSTELGKNTGHSVLWFPNEFEFDPNSHIPGYQGFYKFPFVTEDESFYQIWRLKSSWS